MNIISRYILRVFAPIFALALAAFVGLYLVVDFFEKVDDLLAEHVDFLNTSLYFLYKVPFLIAQGIPMAVLLATLITLGILSRNRELIAMKAAGLNALYYTGPILAAALFLSLVDFTLGETVAHSMNRWSQDIWAEKVTKDRPSLWWGQENVWYRGDNTIYQVRVYDKRTETLHKVSLYYLDSQFKLTQRLDAGRIRWTGDRWIASDGLVLRFKGSATEQEWFREKELSLPETPDVFSGVEAIPEELDWFQLYSYTKKIREEGYDPVPYQVELHLRTAFPFTTLILALLGIVISLRQGPNSGIFFSIGIALIVAFFFLTMLQIGSSLASAGLLSPLVGVWTANVLFAASGVYFWTITPE